MTNTRRTHMLTRRINIKLKLKTRKVNLGRTNELRLDTKFNKINKKSQEEINSITTYRILKVCRIFGAIPNGLIAVRILGLVEGCALAFCFIAASRDALFVQRARFIFFFWCCPCCLIFSYLFPTFPTIEYS